MNDTTGVVLVDHWHELMPEFSNFYLSGGLCKFSLCSWRIVIVLFLCFLTLFLTLNMKNNVARNNKRTPPPQKKTTKRKIFVPWCHTCWHIYQADICFLPKISTVATLRSCTTFVLILTFLAVLLHHNQILLLVYFPFSTLEKTSQLFMFMCTS